MVGQHHFQASTFSKQLPASVFETIDFPSSISNPNRFLCSSQRFLKRSKIAPPFSRTDFLGSFSRLVLNGGAAGIGHGQDTQEVQKWWHIQDGITANINKIRSTCNTNIYSIVQFIKYSIELQYILHSSFQVQTVCKLIEPCTSKTSALKFQLHSVMDMSKKTSNRITSTNS